MSESKQSLEDLAILEPLNLHFVETGQAGDAACFRDALADGAEQKPRAPTRTRGLKAPRSVSRPARSLGTPAHRPRGSWS